MQSIDGDAVVPHAASNPQRRPLAMGRIALFAVLPLLGILSELKLGALEAMLVMFPTPWHTAAVVVAVLLNIALHFGAWRRSPVLPVRAAVAGYVAGMALLYAFVEAPAGMMILAFLLLVFGWLAAAPYLVLLGLVRVFEDLNTCWRTSGRGVWQLTITVAIFAVVPPLLAVGDFRTLRRDVEDMIELSVAMKQAGNADVEAIAQRVRTGDLEIQRRACAGALPRAAARDAGPLLRSNAWGGETGDFWFRQRPVPVIAAADAVVAFHRAHGRGWQEGFTGWRDDVRGWRSTELSLEWQSSQITARLDPDAAVANVDWLLQITSQSLRLGEASVEFVLPPGGVASSLSLWVDGEERPAAFASGDVVQKAYSKVVAKRRDPALLQETGPGRVRLLVFPVTKSETPMRVRVGFTIPLRMRENVAELWLPQVSDHNFGRRVVAQHSLHVEGIAVPWNATLDASGQHKAIEVPWTPCIAAAKDADGFVVQSVAAREPAPSPAAVVVVIDASATVAEVVPDPALLLQAFPAGTSCVTLMARGEDFRRYEGSTDQPELANWLHAQPLRGGVDARSALAAALMESRSRHHAPIYWLHGGAAVLHDQPWPTFEAGERIYALALSAAANVLCEPRSVLHDLFVEVPRFGSGPKQLVDALAEFVRFGPAADGVDTGAFTRSLVRADSPPAESHRVNDQLARVWALREANAQLRRGDAAGAQNLAVRYRLVTAGTGAVVLENKDQYKENELDPGASIGREPELPIGSGPVPEPGSAVLLVLGLFAVLLWRRRTGNS